MCVAVPFTHQPRASPDPRCALYGYFRTGLSRLPERGEFPAGRLAEPPMAKLLDTVGDGANQQVTAEPRRLAAIEPPPFFAQFVRGAIGKSLEHSRHFYLASYPSCRLAMRPINFRHGN
jgi:hypothetical protein